MRRKNAQCKTEELPLNSKIELAKNAEYHLAWCADHEKLYFSALKIPFSRSKFFRPKLRWKKFL